MFGARSKAGTEAAESSPALGRSLGIIEFNPDGAVRTANENFLAVIGYSLSEIQGQASQPLRGAGLQGQRRIQGLLGQAAPGRIPGRPLQALAKGGREVWIEATDNPVLDRSGKTYKVVKVATDITRQIAEGADRRGQIEAINKSQAVIAFDLDGVVQRRQRELP